VDCTSFLAYLVNNVVTAFTISEDVVEFCYLDGSTAVQSLLTFSPFCFKLKSALFLFNNIYSSLIISFSFRHQFFTASTHIPMKVSWAWGARWRWNSLFPRDPPTPSQSPCYHSLVPTMVGCQVLGSSCPLLGLRGGCGPRLLKTSLKP